MVLSILAFSFRNWTCAHCSSNPGLDRALVLNYPGPKQVTADVLLWLSRRWAMSLEQLLETRISGIQTRGYR
jgi:hypothetical protein